MHFSLTVLALPLTLVSDRRAKVAQKQKRLGATLVVLNDYNRRPSNCFRRQTIVYLIQNLVWRDSGAPVCNGCFTFRSVLRRTTGYFGMLLLQHLTLYNKAGQVFSQSVLRVKRQ